MDDNDSFLLASVLFLSLLASSIYVGKNYQAILNTARSWFSRPNTSALYQYSVRTNQRRYVDALLDDAERFSRERRPLSMNFRLQQAEAYGEAFKYPVDRRAERIRKSYLDF